MALGLLWAGGLRPATGDGAAARVYLDRATGEMVVELAPTDLAAGASHHQVAQPPVAILELPASGAIYGFRAEVVDSTGRVLPTALLHHFNLIDPDHRELFLPISRRLFAAGTETGEIWVPRLLFGMPVTRGERVLASAMLANPTPVSYHHVRVRLVMAYTPMGRPWPLFHGSPWQLDAAFPVGDKSFDLPPGHSSRSYEGRPALPGTIVGLGGHMHDEGVLIEFTDVTTGQVIYRAAPERDSGGHLAAIPVARLYRWNRLGVHIAPDHTYRVAVQYDNPTSHVLADAGMGVVGGLFVPDRGIVWPAADTTNQLYQEDLRHAMRLGGTGMDMMMGMAHAPGDAHAHH